MSSGTRTAAAAQTIKEFERAVSRHREAVTVGDAEASEHERTHAHHLLDAYMDMVTEIVRS